MFQHMRDMTVSFDLDQECVKQSCVRLAEMHLRLFYLYSSVVLIEIRL